jgi:lambda repressor-like predicted transcriptional regulator
VAIFKSKHDPFRVHLVAQLQISGSSITELSEELGVSVAHVSNVISGRNKSFRVASTIANRIGSTPQRLWPLLYCDNEEGEAT